MQDSGDVVFEPGVRDSRLVPVAVVRRTLWHKEQNFVSRNFAKRGTRYRQVCGRGQNVTEFSPDIHYRSLFLTVFFAYLHCSAASSCSKRALSKKKRRTSHRIGPDPEAGGSRFWTSKTSLSPQVAQKTGPVTKPQILLTTRLMSTSGALTHLHSLEIAPSAQLF